MKIGIIGLGAVGILYADLLQRGLPEGSLFVLMDEARKERTLREGIYCNGQKMNLCIVTPKEAFPLDLLLFTTKFYGLQGAIETARPFVGEKTLLLSAINGISSEALLEEAFGEDKVLYAVAQGMDANREGNHQVYTQTGVLLFGDRQSGVISEKTRRVKEMLDTAGFPCQIADDMRRRQWAKLMFNVGINQVCAVYGETYGDLQREGPHRREMIEAMREAMIVAQKEGIALSDGDIASYLTMLDGLNPAMRPSMAQDVLAGRQNEVELFSGTICRLGRKHQIPTPVNDKYYEILSVK